MGTANDELFAKFVRENQDKIYRFAYSYVKNEEIALDMVQDAIVLALENMTSLRKIEYMKSWFYRILINECLKNLRSQKRMNLLPLEDEMIEDPAALNVFETDEMLSLIDCLDQSMKTIIFLRFYEDMKLEQIAEITNTNLSTVKTRLYRALQILRANYKE